MIGFYMVHERPPCPTTVTRRIAQTETIGRSPARLGARMRTRPPRRCARSSHPALATATRLLVDDVRATERTRGRHHHGRLKAVRTGTSVFVRLSLSMESALWRVTDIEFSMAFVHGLGS